MQAGGDGGHADLSGVAKHLPSSFNLGLLHQGIWDTTLL